MAPNSWSSTKKLIIGGFGSGKTNSLFNLINQQPDIDEIYLYAKDPYEAKYKFLIDPIVTELFIRGRKLKISITQSYFSVPKNIRLNSMHYFIMKILNKRELQQTAFNHSSDIDFKDFMSLYKKCTTEPYFF